MSVVPIAGEPTDVRAQEVPAWVLWTLGVLLAIILSLVGVTLYSVSQLQDQTAEATETAKTVTATKALVNLVAARQLKSQDLPAKLEGAVAGMTTLLTQTQSAIDATNQALAATNQTLDETNALLDQAEAGVAKAQQAAASLKSQVGEVQQGQKAAGSFQAQLDALAPDLEAAAALGSQLDALAKAQQAALKLQAQSRQATVKLEAQSQQSTAKLQAQSQQTAAKLQSQLVEFGREQQAMAGRVDQALAKLELHLTAIDRRLEELGPR